MTINFNQYPYYDDYDSDKNFHRILFKGGVSVQSRELTQSQTILQNQINKFGDHIFKNNSIVSGGQITHNFNVYFIKLNSINQNNEDVVASDFLNKTLTDSTNSINAKVIQVSEKIIDNNGQIVQPPTLIVAYLSGDHFGAGDTIYIKNTNIISTIISQYSIYTPATGLSSVISITDGVFYINGYFVDVQQQTISLDLFSNTPSARVGLIIEESIVDANEDPSLLDPLLGASNFQAPGADRYRIKLTLTYKPLTLGTDENFIELVRFENGIITKSVTTTQYSIIDDYFARRTFETNGDFIVNKFKLTTTANTASNTSFILKVGPGKAYVRGYIIENQNDLSLTVNKARDYDTQLENTIYLNYGSYLYIDNIVGQFDFKNYMPIDFHVISTANTANTLSYNATKAGTAKLRALEFSNYTNSANTLSYVYKASVIDISTNSYTFQCNGTTSSSNTVIFPNYFPTVNNSLLGVKLQINSGNNAGDLVTISAYDGISKKATASRNFIRDVEGNADITLIYDTKDFESLYSTANNYINAKINSASKNNGLSTGDVTISNTGDEELLYQLGNPYVKSESILNTEYYSWIVKNNIAMNGGTISLPSSMEFIGNDGDLALSTINDNYICYVSNPGTSGLAQGSIISFANNVTRNITLSATGHLATFTCSDLTDVQATVYTKVYITDAYDNLIIKAKNIVSANIDEVFLTGTEVSSNTFVDTTHGQIYIKKSVFNSNNQSLYISDARYIMKIIDTLDANVAANKYMIANTSNDITRYYSFDNGQRDNYYDHCSISLLKNAPPPKGNILVFLNYYSHTSGDGYFSLDSYLSKSSAPEQYEYIPFYISKRGINYNLRDCIDFRPVRLNSNSSFLIKTINNPAVGIPVDGSNYKFDYSYYLGRKDLLIISKDKELSVIQGISSLNPIEPNEPDGSIILAKLTLDPYTTFVPGDNGSGDVSSIVIQYMTYKRWRMQDITTLEDRVSRIEYYTSLNNLEQSAKSLQIPDEYGINRFKNGILTDDFTTYVISDTSNKDYFASIDPIKKRLYPVHEVQNYPLFLKDALNNFGQLDPTIENSLNYNIDMEGINSYVSLKYTEVNAAQQPYASRTVNLNPFNFITKEGVCQLNPPMDNWVSTERLPDLLIVNPDTQLYLQTNTFNQLSTGSWQSISSTNLTQQSSSGVNSTATSADNKTVSPHTFVNNYITSVVIGLQFMELNNLYQLIAQTGKTKYTSMIEQLRLYFISGVIPKASEYNESLVKNIVAKPQLLPYIKSVIETYLIDYANTQTSWNLGSTSTSTTSSTTTSTTTQSTTTSGYWENLGDNFNNNNGYVTDVSLNPYIRGQQIEFTASGLLHNCNVNCYFDGINVSDRVRQTNKITIITSANNSFRTGEIFGYNVGDDFKPVAKIINVYTQNTYNQIITDNYNGESSANLTSKWGTNPKVVVCDIVWDVDAQKYSNGKTLSKNYDIATLLFDTDGNYISVNSSADIIDVERRTGKVLNVISDTLFEIPKFYDTQVDDINTDIKYDWWWFINDRYEFSVKRTGAYLSSSNTIYIFCNNHIVTTNTVIGSVYTTKPEYSDIVDFTGNLKTDETGSISGIFYLQPDTFHTGEKTFRIDNRIAENSGSETTYAQSVFFATSLNVQKQYLDFAPDIGSAKNVFTKTETSTNIVTTTTTDTNSTNSTIKIKNDPVAQSFIFYSDQYPNGLFIKSIRVCFYSKPVDHFEPVTLSLLAVTNGYPNGDTLPHSIVTKTPDEIIVSDSPNINDANTYTKFTFNIPIYIKPDILYSFMLKTNSDEYFAYIANLGDFALASSVPDSTVPVKISSTPYIGNLFLSQNTITWGADQNKNLMFGIDRCEFDISQTAQIQYVIPYGLPQRRFADQSLSFIESPSLNISNNTPYTYSTVDNFPVDSFNVTTTDLTFEKAPITYSYRSTLSNGVKDTYENYITPGKYGTATIDDIMLDDGKGERMLFSDSSSLLANSSFSLYARLSSLDSKISPILADTGLSLYAVNYKINNLGLYNKDFIILDGGNGYSENPIITITSTGEGAGSGATANCIVVANTITSINVISNGNNYANGAIVTITDSLVPTSNANIIVNGETSNHGGNALCRDITKPVTLLPGFDAGDLRVYITAYRPLGTNIYIYYKILNRNDTQTLFDCNWQLMTTISGSTLYSKNRGDTYEYVYAPGINNVADNKVSYVNNNGITYTNFYQWVIKIVYSTNDNTVIPYLNDLRAIALPEPI